MSLANTGTVPQDTSAVTFIKNIWKEPVTLGLTHGVMLCKVMGISCNSMIEFMLRCLAPSHQKEPTFGFNSQDSE